MGWFYLTIYVILPIVALGLIYNLRKEIFNKKGNKGNE